jgi:hypothetical protein
MKFSALSLLALAATFSGALANGKKGGDESMPSGNGGKKGGSVDPFFIRSIGFDQGFTFEITNGVISSSSTNGIGTEICNDTRCLAGNSLSAIVDTGSNTLEMALRLQCRDYEEIFLFDIVCPDPQDNMELVASTCTTRSRVGETPATFDTCEIDVFAFGNPHGLVTNIEFDEEFDPSCFLEINVEIECGPDIVSIPAPTDNILWAAVQAEEGGKEEVTENGNE